MLILIYYSVVAAVGVLMAATLWYIDKHWKHDS